MTYNQSLRAAWLLNWPHLLLLGGILIVPLVASAPPAFLGLILPLLPILFIGAGPLVFSPWVFARMLRKQFRGFRFTIIRPMYPTDVGPNPQNKPTYQELACLAWLYWWRNWIVVLPITIVEGAALPQISRLMQPARFVVALAIILLPLLVWLLLTSPWTVRVMVRKRFSGFRIEVNREEKLYRPENNEEEKTGTILNKRRA